jgi:hypothetical protein
VYTMAHPAPNRQSNIADRQSRVPQYDTSEKNVLAKQSHLTPPLYAPPAPGRTTRPASIPNLKRTQTNPPSHDHKCFTDNGLPPAASPKCTIIDTKRTRRPLLICIADLSEPPITTGLAGTTAMGCFESNHRRRQPSLRWSRVHVGLWHGTCTENIGRPIGPGPVLR